MYMIWCLLTCCTIALIRHIYAIQTNHNANNEQYQEEKQNIHTHKLLTTHHTNTPLNIYKVFRTVQEKKNMLLNCTYFDAKISTCSVMETGEYWCVPCAQNVHLLFSCIRCYTHNRNQLV